MTLIKTLQQISGPSDTRPRTKSFPAQAAWRVGKTTDVDLELSDVLSIHAIGKDAISTGMAPVMSQSVLFTQHGDRHFLNVDLAALDRKISDGANLKNTERFLVDAKALGVPFETQPIELKLLGGLRPVGGAAAPKPPGSSGPETTG